jgi:hypothetical protein
VNGSWLRTGPRHLLSSRIRVGLSTALCETSLVRVRAHRRPGPRVPLMLPYDEPRPFEDEQLRVTKRASAVSSTLGAQCALRPRRVFSPILAVLPARMGHVRRCGGSVFPFDWAPKPRGPPASRSERPAPAHEPPVARRSTTHRWSSSARGYRLCRARPNPRGPELWVEPWRARPCATSSIAPVRSSSDTFVVVG